MIYRIVLNPAGASGGAGKICDELIAEFERCGAEFELYCSVPGRGIEEICRSLTSRGEDTALVVIGGDGSLNEAVNGIADFEHTALGFIPCGTGNDMQRDMGLPKCRAALVRRILGGVVRRTADIGETAFFG